MKKIYILLAAAALIAPAMSSAQKMTVTNISKEKTYKTSTHNIDVWYQGEVNLGYAVSGKCKLDDEGDIEKFKTNYSRPLIETVHGVRITKYAFVGAGVAVQYAPGKINPDVEDSDEKWNTLMIPLFFNLKGYYPVTDDFAPYISLSFGGSICATSSLNDSGIAYGYNYDDKLKGGFYSEYGIGFNYKRLNFGLGLQHQTMKRTLSEGKYSSEEKWSINSFYVKVGLTF